MLILTLKIVLTMTLILHVLHAIYIQAMKNQICHILASLKVIEGVAELEVDASMIFAYEIR